MVKLSNDPMFETELYARRQRAILAAAEEVVRILRAEFARSDTPTMWVESVGTSQANLVTALMIAHGWEKEGMEAIRISQQRIYGNG